MLTSISREYWFSAAHRLEGHPKCGRLHGHNYRVVVTLFGTPAENGMVLDYGLLDKMVKPFIDDFLDHKYIVSEGNEEAQDVYAQAAYALGHAFMLNAPASTAENIAKTIYDHIDYELQANYAGPNITGIQVQVDETHKSTAVYPVRP